VQLFYIEKKACKKKEIQKIHLRRIDISVKPQSIQNTVPGFLSSLPNWILPPPHPPVSVAPPPFGSKGGDTLAYWGGVGGTQLQRRELIKVQYFVEEFEEGVIGHGT
jgi:hypothetical protein